MSDPIDLVFGAGGLLSQKFVGYEPRPQQVQLARAVFDSMATGDRLLAEAPTGVGKSIGYLVPAIWHVTEGADEIRAWRRSLTEEDEDGAGFDEEPFDEEQGYVGTEGGQGASEPEAPPRVLIVTANIALQEQILQKDVPLLHEILPWHFKAAIAKGRGNYLCHAQRDENLAEVAMEPHKLTREDRQKWEVVNAWVPKTTTGDLSELPFELGPDLKKRLTMTSDDCTGKACDRFGDCFAERARAELKTANVIVTNYHLFSAHLAIAAEFGSGVLPRFDLVVGDEAHELADVARSFFGFRLTEGGFKWALRFLGPMPARHKGGADGWDIDPDLRNEILEGASYLFEDLDTLRRSPKYFARLHTRFPGDWEQLTVKLRRAHEACDKVAAQGLVSPKRQEELRKASRRIRLMGQNLAAALDPTADVDGRYAFFLEETPSRKTAVCAKPIHVNDLLRERVFEAKAFKSIVCTSATLATGTSAKAFDFIVSEVGAESANELIVASPFDFERQAMLVVPQKMHDPKKPEWLEDVARICVELVGASQGRALLLFTSHRATQAAAIAVRKAHGDRFRILVQGDAPRTQLVQQFRADTSSVLLGTRSLWAGVDVSGESCSAVFIDKLPFDPPSDPVLDALNAQSDRTFVDYSVPRAAIALRQGCGRLIRSLRDRGVVVVADRRLVDKAWAKRIRNALPPMVFTREMADVAAFLKGEGDASAA